MTIPSDACRRARRALAARPDGELAPPEQLALERHLASCDACRAYGEGIDGALDALREIPASLPFPDEALEQIWDRTLRAQRSAPRREATPRASVPPGRRRRSSAWPIAAAAAVLLAAIVGPYLALRGAGSTSPPPAAAASASLSPEERRAAADLKLVLQLTDRAVERSRRAAIDGVIRRGVDPALRRVPVLRGVVGVNRDADGSGEVLR